MADTYCRGQ